MSVVLYHSWFSTCSQKVRLALSEKHLAYESVVIDLTRQEHLTAEYLAINPNGVVPSLKHDHRVVIDSSVICEYLDEVFPGYALSPPDAYGRAQMRTWMRYFEEVPTTAIRAPSFSKLFSQHFTAMKEDEFSRLAEKMPIRKHFYQQMGRSGFTEQQVTESLEKLRSCLERVNNALADGRDYLLGDVLSIADIVLLPSGVRLIDLQYHDLWKDLPAFDRWLARAQKRPSFAQAYPQCSRFQL